MSEPTPATPTGARPPSMRERWADLISSTHSPRRWAVIAAAMHTADATSVDQFGEPVQRGDETWCRVALTALESPTSAAAARALPDGLPTRCLANRDLLRSWLDAPVGYAEPGRTVADGLDLVHWATASPEAIHRAITNLIEQAQDAGVFGVDRYRVEVRRLVDTDDRHSGYLLVARPPFGPGLASDQLDDAQLIPTYELSFVEDAVRVLTKTATLIDTVLNRRNTAEGASSAAPEASRGHPFRAGPPADAARPAPPPAAGDPPPAPRHPRTR